jgi:hypothetical protein
MVYFGLEWEKGKKQQSVPVVPISNRLRFGAENFFTSIVWLSLFLSFSLAGVDVVDDDADDDNDDRHEQLQKLTINTVGP